MLLGWTAGVTFVYAGQIGSGTLIYGRTTLAIVWIAVFVVSGVVLVRVVQRLWSGECTKAVILARVLGTRMRAPDGAAALAADQAAAADTGVKAMIPVGRPFLDYVLSGLADAGFTRGCQAAQHVIQKRADRKSTRLNSSHLVISYALFYL